MTLTDEQCAVLEKIASKSKMDCWFYIDGDNQIRDLEEGERVINTGNIPNAEFVSLYRGLVGTECADEDLAVQLAKADGVKFIEGMNGVPDNYYIDTPQNRNAILKHLQADNH